MKNLAIMAGFLYDIMMINNSGLLFWATLYIKESGTKPYILTNRRAYTRYINAKLHDISN